MFKNILLVAIIVASLFCALTRATPTDPVVAEGSKLPLQYLIFDQAGLFRFSYSPPPASKQNEESVVATFRWGGAGFQAQTGWSYLQITSRADKKLKQQQRPPVGVPRRDAKKHYPLAGLFAADQKNSKNQKDGSFEDYIQYWYGGIIEGYLTAMRFGATVKINKEPQYKECQQKFMDAHFDYLMEKYAEAEANPNMADGDFWRQQVRIWHQLEGIAVGYNKFMNASITGKDVYLLNFNNMGSVNAYCALQRGEEVKKTSSGMLSPHHELADGSVYEFIPLMQKQHCSALIKVTHNDMYVAHDTWSGFYGQMGQRFFKVYSFSTQATVAMTSYPFTVSSIDDWYETSNELAVWETTNEVFNMSLYKACRPQQCAEFSRVMAGNYLAETAEQWAKYFSFENNGGYNNGYIAVDFKRFTPGQPFSEGVFWLAEQIPGLVMSADWSKKLSDASFFSSFNVPHFKYIYDISGYAEMEKEQGTFWSLTKYARPEIFAHGQKDIFNISGMQRMMRWNQWRTDPYSKIPNCTGATDGKCDPAYNGQSPMLAIASRGDLLPVYKTEAENIAHYGPLYQMVAQGCFGAVDSKIASWSNRKTLTARIINGPTNDNVPTFNWGGACNYNVPADTPAVFDYPWVDMMIADDWKQ